MPKLNNRPPKYSKMGKYAVVYARGKPNYLGLHGSPESKIAYARFIAELQANPIASPSNGEKSITVSELTAAFLDHAQANTDPTYYTHCRIIAIDFLYPLFGDGTSVDNFKPSCLTLVRKEMIKSRRFCRRTINDYTFRIISIFAWGVRNDLVHESTVRALRVVKSLRKGEEGTFDNEKRQPIPDDVVIRTLPFMPPTLRAMVQLQRILGMRPSEIFKMRVGNIDTTRGNGLWYYTPGSYKTEAKTGEIPDFPLGNPEQELIAPYLVGKKPEEAVFSPRTAMAERNAEKRAKRKSKPTPSQLARAAETATKPSRYSEFYNRDSYRNAIVHAIEKGNKVLPDGEKIPHWYPYLLRNSAATDIESEVGLDAAQAQLGHTTADMTRRYSKARLRIREQLARNRRNPFDAGNDET